MKPAWDRCVERLKRKQPFDWCFWTLAGLVVTIVQFPFLLRAGWYSSATETQLFFLSSWLQGFLLICAGVLLDLLIDPVTHRRWRGFFDGICVFVLLAIMLDYACFSQIGLHSPGALWEYARNGVGAFVSTLQITGVPMWKILLFAGFVFSLPVIGWLVLPWTRRLSARRPQPLSALGVIVCAASLVCMLFAVQWYDYRNTDIRAWLKRKVMPFHFSFFELPANTIGYPVRVPELARVADMEAAIASVPIVGAKTNDVFIFVMESVRRASCDAETAPNFDLFRGDCLVAKETLPGANVTPLSWLALFHGKQPLYQRQIRRSPDRWGALPLKLFRRLGYSIHVYAASDITYEGLRDVIFGKEAMLADSVLLDPDPPLGDRRVAEVLIEKLRNEERAGGRLFVIFLEAVHHDYRWPDDYPAKFTPYAESVSYLSGPGDPALMINRYRNAIHFVDHLFGRIVATLKETGRYDDSIIVATGDHGEEFGEFGGRLHGSDLNHLQASVPLLIKLPADDSARRAAPGVAGHVDVLPTVFTALGLRDLPVAVFDGAPLQDRKGGFALTMGRPSGDDPDSFFLHDGSNKAHFQFLPGERGDGSSLYCYKITDHRDQDLGLVEQGAIRNFIRKHFTSAMEEVFAEVKLD